MGPCLGTDLVGWALQAGQIGGTVWIIAVRQSVAVIIGAVLTVVDLGGVGGCRADVVRCVDEAVAVVVVAVVADVAAEAQLGAGGVAVGIVR